LYDGPLLVEDASSMQDIKVVPHPIVRHPKDTIIDELVLQLV
jgi:hypothetical protein